MAWPTMRVLRELTKGWENMQERSLIAGNDWKSLPLLTGLSHPAIRACQTFDTTPGSSKFERHKAASEAAGYPVIEAKDLSTGPGWRAAIVVRDGVSWIVHVDTHDAFHSGVASRFGEQYRVATEPTDDDIALRKLKLAEAKTLRLVRAWREEIITETLAAFRDAFQSSHSGEETRRLLPSPPAEFLHAGADALEIELVISVVADSQTWGDSGSLEGGEALATVNIKFDAWNTVRIDTPNPSEISSVETLLLATVLRVLDAREETWTKEPAAYYGQDGSLVFDIPMSRMRALQILFAAENDGSQVDSLEKETREEVCHFVTREALQSAIANQEPLRAVCGYWFVPARFPDGFPVCRDCSKEARVIRFLNQDLT